MRIRTLAELKQAALRSTPPVVVVAAAGDPISLEAIIAADECRLARGVLVGPAGLIRDRLEHLGVTASRFEIEDAADPVQAAIRAVELVSRGEGEILLKGSVSTASLLHAVLGPGSGLKTGRLLSDVIAFEDERESVQRLILCSDGGVNIAPNLKQKVQIIRNAVWVAQRLGLERPKVALLSGVERVTPDMQSTIDAVALAKMASYGDVITGCIVDGPFALDNAISPEAARIKGIESPVAGQADVLIMPTLENGNIFGKALMYYANKTLAHVIVGAGAPVLICSRADTVEAKLCSIALGALCAGKDSSVGQGEG
ncbi:MAG: bifunctional enoyl-CoA hydratase/phosphate acetyltransferase [Myxococcota bacterium]|jgi:phosphate butyryltransferase|nr:bifunctional enoyl-CoA hydratase/phosphate acetyltransferase [Myxococcota bacterium]